MAQDTAVDLVWKLLEDMSRQFVRSAWFLSRSRPPQRRDSLGAICLPSRLRQRRGVIKRVISRLPLRRPLCASCGLSQSLLDDFNPLLPSRHMVAVFSDDLCIDVWFHFGRPDVVSATATGRRYPMAASTTGPMACCGRKHHSSHLCVRSSSFFAIAESTCARFRELEDRRTRGDSDEDISTRAQQASNGVLRAEADRVVSQARPVRCV